MCARSFERRAGRRAIVMDLHKIRIMKRLRYKNKYLQRSSSTFSAWSSLARSVGLFLLLKAFVTCGAVSYRLEWIIERVEGFFLSGSLNTHRNEKQQQQQQQPRRKKYSTKFSLSPDRLASETQQLQSNVNWRLFRGENIFQFDGVSR